MCKNTQDEPVGIPVPLPTVLPPIENWYVVARNPLAGTFTIYKSWEEYHSKSKKAAPVTSSPPTAETKKSAVEDDASLELSAFPTMVQAITYIKTIEPKSPKINKSSPLRSPTSSNTPTSKSTSRRMLPLNLSKSAIPEDARSSSSSPSNIISHKQLKRARKRAARKLKKSRTIDVDSQSSCSNEETAVRPPSPVHSSPDSSQDGSQHRKRSIERRTSSPDVTHESPPKRSKPDTSNLDALAMLASASRNKKSPESKEEQKSPQEQKSSRTAINPSATKSMMESKNAAATRTKNEGGARLSPSTDSGAKLPREGATAKTSSPREIILPRSRTIRLPENTMGRLPEIPNPPRVVSTSSLPLRNRVPALSHNQLEQQLQREQEELQKQLEEKQRRLKSLTSKMTIPKVPTTLTSSLRIPEVPRGFVPAEAPTSDRISRAVAELRSAKIASSSHPSPTMLPPSAPTLGQLSLLESNSLRNLQHQLQQLPQQLRALGTSGIRSTPSSRIQELLLQEQRQNHALAQAQLHHIPKPPPSLLQLHLARSAGQQQLAMDLAAASASVGSSDCDHSEITIKRRNGGTAESPSRLARNSPLVGGMIYTRTQSPAENARREHGRDS